MVDHHPLKTNYQTLYAFGFIPFDKYLNGGILAGKRLQIKRKTRLEMSAGQFSMMGILILVDCSLWHLESLSTVPSTSRMCLKTRLTDSGFLKGQCTSQRHPTTFKGLLFCPLFKCQMHQRVVRAVWSFSQQMDYKFRCAG